MFGIEELAKMEEGGGGFRSSTYQSSSSGLSPVQVDDRVPENENRHIASTGVNKEARVPEIEEVSQMEEGRVCTPIDLAKSIVGKINSVGCTEVTWWARDGFIHKRMTKQEVEDFYQRQIYKPYYVSIGPYYHGDSKLMDMENMKWMCLRYLTTTMLPLDKLESNLEECLQKLKNEEEDTRKLYGEIEMRSDEFVRMLLLDTCFIITFILLPFWPTSIFRYVQTANKNPFESFDPRNTVMYDDVYCDILMPDNQIPSSIIIVIWRWLNRAEVFHDSTDLNHVMSLFFKSTILKSFYPIKRVGEPSFGTPFSHVLHLLHQYICFHQSDNYDDDDATRGTWTPTVTELEKVGVKFKRKIKATSFLDITFKGGVLEVPKLPTLSFWKLILRNLMDFENGVPRKEAKVRGYVFLMGYLLKTSNDARILGQASIFDNEDGTEEDIPKFLVELWSQGCGNRRYNFPIKLAEAINKYRKSRSNLWIVLLKRNYCDNPWFITSIIVAAILLLATVTALGFQIKFGYHPRSS